MQVQFKKAEKLSKCAKDFILTNLNIKEYSVQTIDGKPADLNMLLPTDLHPFDHFVVNALIWNKCMSIIFIRIIIYL